MYHPPILTVDLQPGQLHSTSAAMQGLCVLHTDHAEHAEHARASQASSEVATDLYAMTPKFLSLPAAPQQHS